jgi:CheY-like chemotaxis protein
MEASSTRGGDPGAVEAAPEPGPIAIDAPSRGLILLVDDEPGIARAYGRSLRTAGFTVVTAADGHEAAVAARDKSFDVIISDIGMPGMDGINLLRATSMSRSSS